MRIWPGTPYPLGANYDGSGTNFSIFSEIAERVELCLFSHSGTEKRVDLPEVTGYCWHGYLPRIEPGQRYGYRVHGPWDPHNGHRCNAHKLLLDPYSKAIDGHVKWNRAVFPYDLDGGLETANVEDDARYMPKSVVHQPHFEWAGDQRLQLPWHETIIYETHVKGLTARHPDVPAERRGTYAGLAEPVIIDYFQQLGITAVELMPIHQFIQDQHLVDQG
ncbi:MAG: glycogen debranching enzyme, partial [Acidobacteriota bacterium]